MRPFRIIGPVLLVIALACAIGLGWNLRPNKYEGWVETSGTVVSHTYHRDYDRRDRSSDETWGVVVRFSDEAGVEHQVESATRSNNPKPVGDTVDVRYPPGQPEQAKIGMDAWFWVMFLGIWTLVLSILGIAFTVAGRATRRMAPAVEGRAGAKIEDANEPTFEDTREPTFEEPPFDEFRPGAGDTPEDGWPRRPG
ncbi:DUF3592 domain-containing protein [Ammonicoccus fulvus]|uniref:DUF3592 domain-containing protein n=1 Tax=Ammonicoccus fulvus TaxID=3138240 RepID=A0ABZ3FJ54_9ACTN